ncbi:metal tolerance protein A2 [Actinidia rufa]|uniref:Metal tolerance protein A2 n=1 Tax=Actinidia rufa TaxID=165716 RepID=A0A7J0D9Z5_9ERIC|nr:metal tolerance protein A2 [Actinidia rufa]
MEHQEVSSLMREHRQASEETSGLPLSLQLPCSHVCAFSTEDSDGSASHRQSKSAVKLCGLKIFSTIFMAAEVFGGMKDNSLAFLTDAAHLLTDISGFSISLFTIWASSWAATSHQSFGFKRLEVLGALASVPLIWLVCGILIYEAVDRILHKNTRVNGKLMFAIAALGFVINFIMVIWLGHGHSHPHCKHKDHNHEKEESCARNEEESTCLVSTPAEKTETWNINLQWAYLHVIADLIQSVGVMIA